MGLLDDCQDLLNSDIRIVKKGGIVSTGPGGPVYGPDVECYDSKGAIVQLSTREMLVYEKLGYPSTHKIVLFPDRISEPVVQGAEATVDGVEYVVYPGENDVMNLGDVAEFTVARRA